METKNRHPLEAITHSESLSMLETLIPFVDYPLKLPLALFIKFNEIKLIINAFCSIDTLSRFGLHAASSSPTDMLCALTGMSPDMLKMLMSLSENMNGSFAPEMLSGLSGQNGMDFSNLANILNQFGTTNMNAPSSSSTPAGSDEAMNHNTPPANHSSDSFDSAIQNILSEYDMAQAENFTKDLSNNDSNQEVLS